MIKRGRQRIKQFSKAVTKSFIPSFRLGVASDYNGNVFPRTCTVTIGSSVLTSVRIMDHVLAPVADGVGVWVASIGVGKNIIIGKVSESPLDVLLNDIIANKILLTSAGGASLDSESHGIQVGSSDGPNIIMSRSEIQARDNGAGAELVLNQSGAQVTVGEFLSAARVRVRTSTDVSHDSTDHGFQIGSDTGENLRMDVNEILCSNNGGSSKLFIQGDSSLGGDVGIGHGGAGSLVDICSQPFSPIGNNTVGAGWAAASGWSLTMQQCRRMGPMAVIAGQVERTGSDISVSSTGDIGNTALATATGTNANGNSNVHWGISSGSVGRLTTITFNPSSGQLTLCAISPSVNISTGNTISFAGIVPVEVR